ncbi:hypothetical protein AYJ56_14510 [Brucella anthropi]|nr:hypothetical protein AYJ56_14510 [Brucella anthropi]
MSGGGLQKIKCLNEKVDSGYKFCEWDTKAHFSTLHSLKAWPQITRLEYETFKLFKDFGRGNSIG